MYAVMTTFVDRLDSMHGRTHTVIPWGCPVPFFGDLSSALVATVGINPSNREFTSVRGVELSENERRLPTLGSLGISRWSDANASHLRTIIDACSRYFRNNPYDRWFQVLETVLLPLGGSFYGNRPTACHVDLVPFATAEKWTLLSKVERARLLSMTGDALGALIRDSSLEVLVLNGRSVVEHFERLADLQLERSAKPLWSLPRESGPRVGGVAYSGEVDEFAGVRLGRPIRVLGYNHNLQSSFGVTAEVVALIGWWLSNARDAPRG
jgi:hypothetical protein